MGVVYFSIIPTFEPSRYCKCWIVCFYYIIFSLGGFTEELLAVAHERNVMLLTLEDLYNYFNRML